MSDTFSAICPTRELAHSAALDAYRCAQAMIANGQMPLIECRIALEPIGIQQRRFLHGPVLGQISEQARVDGVRYTADIWKEHFRRQLLPVEYEMRRLPGAKRATPHKVRTSTEELGVRAYAQFIDRVIDYAVVELGVEFHFTHEEQLLRHPPKRKA